MDELYGNAWDDSAKTATTSDWAKPTRETHHTSTSSVVEEPAWPSSQSGDDAWVAHTLDTHLTHPWSETSAKWGAAAEHERLDEYDTHDNPSTVPEEPLRVTPTLELENELSGLPETESPVESPTKSINEENKYYTQPNESSRSPSPDGFSLFAIERDQIPAPTAWVISS